MRSGRHSRLTALASAVAVGLSLLAGCAQAPAANEPPKSVSESALTGLLLNGDDIDAVMSTDKMIAHPPVAQMGDHRNLLPNLNCLGVWQVNEAPIYDPSDWQSVRQQMLRSPDSDNWDSLVVQSVVSYRSPRSRATLFHRVGGSVGQVHQPPRQHPAQRSAVARVAQRRSHRLSEQADDALRPWQRRAGPVLSTRTCGRRERDSRYSGMQASTTERSHPGRRHRRVD